MIAILAAAMALTPTDDVWVYPHAGDPARDAYLRVWGNDGRAAAGDAGELESFSYGYLRFDTSGLPEAPPKAARLTVYQTANPPYTLEEAKAAPLQVRGLPGAFLEKEWSYGLAEALRPASDANAVFGGAFPEKLDGDAPLPITVDLLSGPGKFSDALVEAVKAKKPLSLALTAALDVSQDRRSYKLYSKDAENAAFRPRLELEY